MENKDLVFAPLSKQLDYLEEILKENIFIVEVLEKLSQINLPNWYIAGGILYQSIWNKAHGFSLEHGIKDIDIVFFDPKDLTDDTEKRVHNELVKSFPDSSLAFEVTNQARAHLWYEEDFNLKINPYHSTEEAIFCVSAVCMVIGLRVNAAKEFEFFAPFGVSDILGLIVRPSKIQKTRKMYEDKVNRWKSVWPKLTIFPYDTSDVWDNFTAP